jgi:hypothetical protein
VGLDHHRRRLLVEGQDQDLLVRWDPVLDLLGHLLLVEDLVRRGRSHLLILEVRI